MKSILNFSFAFLGILLISSCIDEKEGSSSTDNFDRKTLLTSLADNQIIPAYEEFRLKLTDLENAHNSFKTTPNQANLDALRASFEAAYINWQYIEIYGMLDLESGFNYQKRMNSFPVSTTENPNGPVEVAASEWKTINNNISSGSYDLGSSLNFSTQGFPALDFLLYGLATSDAEILDFYNAVDSKELAYLNVVVTTMANLTDSVINLWKGPARNSFVSRDGNTNTSSLNILANGFLFHYERLLREARISFPATLRDESNIPDPTNSRPVEPHKIEAYYHGNLSRQLFLASLDASEKLFCGINNSDENALGFDDYLDHLNRSDIKNEILNNYLDSKEATNLESKSFLTLLQENNKNYFYSIFQELQKNTISIQVDMFSAMNIAPTSQGVMDGD